MTFQAARCPNCAGELQVPDDRATVKCMYCGGDLVVQEAIRLAAGRVREFTQVTREEENIYISRKQIFGYVLLGSGLCLAGIALMVNVSVADGGVAFGLILIFLGILLPLIYVPHVLKVTGHQTIFKGFKGLCPYCDSEILVSPQSVGFDCPVCKKRIVFRDMKFYSVDTPVSGLRKTSS